MPSKSKKQFNFMRALAGGAKSKLGNAGPSEAVAEEFVKKTPKEKRMKWSKK